MQAKPSSSWTALSSPETAGPPPLPPGYEAEEVLGRRPGMWVVRARRAAEDVVLRLETRAGAGEGAAELSVLASVDHPGLARLVDHGALAGGGRFVARRFVAGADLLRWSAGRSPEELGRAVSEVAQALDHLHRRGFVHGDLKPENVIVDPAGRVVLTDFGLARRAGGPAPGELAGTLYALAPEVLLGAPPSPASDLFALGALLHRLLAGRRASARSFYASFPARSFFDAAGSPPEDLPPWARDLVAALVARDPARRPASAGALARALRARLGLAGDAERRGEELRVPPDLGRERWLGAWQATLVEPPLPGAPPHQWVRLPEGESAPAQASALRLFASLRGAATTGVVLDDEAGALADVVALDRLARRLADGPAGALVVSLSAGSPWLLRALELLVRALRQVPAPAARRLVLVSAHPPPAAEAAAFAEHALPPVALERWLAFLAQHLPGEEPERRADFGRRLHAHAGGAAERLDGLLRRAAADGWLLPDGEGSFALRHGELPDALALAPEARAAEVEGGARAVLAALHVAGGRLGGAELAGLVAGEGVPAGIAQLVERRLALWQGGELALAARPSDPGALGRELLQRLHARRAQALADGGAEPWRVLSQRLGAGEDVARALEGELERMLARGAAELALACLEGAERHAADAGLDLLRAHPRLALLRVRAWAVMGRLEQAERALTALDAGGAPGLALLGRARLAALRRATDEALALYARAEARDPELELDARLGRVQLLHELGRDRETLAAAAQLPVGAAPRQRAFIESLAAVSAFRLGRADEARARLRDLLERAEAAGDADLGGALCIDLATVERRTGDADGAVSWLRRALALYEAAGHAAGLAHARATLGGVLRDRGEMLEAEPLLALAMSMRERLGDPHGANTVRGIYGLLLADRGHARAAIEELERSAERMEGAQRLRFAPLLRARADELRARLGAPAEEAPGEGEEGADPRVFAARARASWLRGDRPAALATARRALELARSLGLAPVEAEAAAVARALDPGAAGDAAPPAGSLQAEDAELLRLLATPARAFDGARARALAQGLEARGRDDRAARLWLALAVRAGSAGPAGAGEAAERCLRRAGAGLTAPEAEALRHHLLGTPDPWPEDLIRAPEDDEEWDMEIASLLEINRRLVAQDDLSSLLGEIVESALKVTGAERGFLVLEEHGALRFDTALDSRRGGIAQPDLEVSTSIIEQALERMQPLRLSNAVDDPLLGHTPSVVSLELRSILCLPFRVDEGVRGAIYVDHRLRTGAFGDKAERLCALLADQAALAIQQVRRMQEIRELNGKLARRVESQEHDLVAARLALKQAGVRPADAGLIGSSEAMARVRTLLDRAAASGLTVLVMGHSGTGKELAARALHDGSPRAAGAFVSESCAALPPSLIESELFGYRRGAFTGAEEDRPGLFERAHGGTLFLDEIGEMPLELQSKLLRVLETGEVRRLGDSESRQVDFRLVAATNRDLGREVQEGRFRADLFYRLDGLRVRMPPLAERPEDIPQLVAHFLTLEQARGGVARRASRAVLDRLAQRAWPGNVRELRNEVARLCVLSEGDLTDAGLVREPDGALAPAPYGEGQPPPTLAELERRAILDALRFAGGDKRKAAQALGISRAKIYQRLKEWRLDEGEAGAAEPGEGEEGPE